MGRFRPAQSQAIHAVGKKLAIGKPRHGSAGKDGKVHSLGTAGSYVQSLKGTAAFIANRKLDPTGRGLASLTRESALAYLDFRCQEVLAPLRRK